MSRKEKHSQGELWSSYSPLMKAAFFGDLERIEALVAEDRYIVNVVSGWNKTTALMLAAQGNHASAVSFLLKTGADFEVTNDLGNTALMLAAEAGNLDIVKELFNFGARLDVQNGYGQTALILATENGCLPVVEWIARNGGARFKQLSVRNKYDKTALLVASQLGKYDIVKFILDTKCVDVNISTVHRGMTSLMYACSYSSDQHTRIVELLLEHNADVNAKSKEDDSALLWAAIGGNATVIEMLLDRKASINDINKRGFTALMKASERGNDIAVRCLISHGADKWIVNFSDQDAMKLAWLQGHVDLATNIFMKDSEFDVMNTPVTSVFCEDELDDLGMIYSSAAHFDSLKVLVASAANYDFHFDLFIRILPRLQTPNILLNKLLPAFYESLYLRSAHMDVDLAFKLVQLAGALSQVELKHPLERIDFQERHDVIMKMLTECVASDCMDDEKNIQEMLCFAIKSNRKRYKDDLVQKAQTFRGGLLEACIRAHVKAIFSSGHISAYVSNLFWGFLRKGEHFRGMNCLHSACTNLLTPITKALKLKFSDESENLRHLRSNFIHARYCPALMFIGEGIGRLILLGLICHLSVVVYYEAESNQFLGELWTEEYLLIVFTLSLVLYEYGEILENDRTIVPTLKNLMDYVSDLWHWIDVVGILLLLSWVALRLQFAEFSFFARNKDGTPLPFYGIRSVLAISSIVFSVSLLRFFSLYEPLGKLTIMVFAMMSDLASFAIFFCICIFGFCVALFSLFRDNYDFKSSGQTALTLFSATLNNYDSSFDSFSIGDKYRTLGVVIQVFYILISSVVLLNLVVARMAATHQKIDERSFQEWQFATGKIVKQFLLFEEKSPLCMLPPPLNLLPSLLFPLHSLYLQYVFWRDGAYQKVMAANIHGNLNHHHSSHYPSVGGLQFNETYLSLAGSASDVLVGVVMAVFAPWLELIIYLFRLLRSVGKAARKRTSARKTKLAQFHLLEPVYMLVVFPVLYPVFVMKLLMEACSLLTRLSLEYSRLGMRRVVEFEQKPLLCQPTVSIDESDVLTVKILRGERLVRCTANSNVAVKLRIGSMELTTGTSIYRGSDPVWNGESLRFPLVGIDLHRDDLSLVFEVVDRDVLTGTEHVVGKSTHTGSQIKRWLANGRFEERIGLEDNAGHLICIGRIQFPSFLSDKFQRHFVESENQFMNLEELLAHHRTRPYQPAELAGRTTWWSRLFQSSGAQVSPRVVSKDQHKEEDITSGGVRDDATSLKTEGNQQSAMVTSSAKRPSSLKFRVKNRLTALAHSMQRPIFTAADKDRIFYHALKAKSRLFRDPLDPLTGRGQPHAMFGSTLSLQSHGSGSGISNPANYQTSFRIGGVHGGISTIIEEDSPGKEQGTDTGYRVHPSMASVAVRLQAPQTRDILITPTSFYSTSQGASFQEAGPGGDEPEDYDAAVVSSTDDLM